jgi:hypothetical protein
MPTLEARRRFLRAYQKATTRDRDRGDRIILHRRDGDRFELVDVGSHDIYRRYP